MTNKAHLLYLIAALPMIFFLVIAQQPFSAPDEVAHFIRAYDLSKLRILPSKTPEGLVAGHPDEAIFDPNLRPSRTVPYGSNEIGKYRSIHWTGRDILAASNAAPYFPLAYVPQTLVVAAGRILEPRLYPTVFAGELFTGIFCVILAAVAIRIAKFGQPLLFFVAALPMSLSLFASFSADALLICSALLATAYLTHFFPIKILEGASSAILGWSVIALTMGCLIATKITYLPLLLIPAAVWLLSYKTIQRSPQRVLVGIFFAALAIIAGWTWVVLTAGHILTPNGDGIAQIAFLRAHPLSITTILLATFREWSDIYLDEMYGVLGWLDILLNPTFYTWAQTAFILAIVSCLFENTRPSWLTFFATLTGIIGTIVLIALALYVGWTPVGQQIVEGVQGRYFLPAIPFAVLALAGCARRIHFPGLVGLAAMALITLADWLFTPAAILAFNAAHRG